MISLLYLGISLFSGYVICSFGFPNLKHIGEYSYSKRPIQLNASFILLPSYFLIGIISLTWSTYIVAYLFRNKTEPLIYGNTVSMIVFLLGSAIGWYFLYRKKMGIDKIKQNKVTRSEWLFLAFTSLLACILMWRTFYVKDNALHVGFTVFSDFSPHLGMIRSFSYGNNFPTAYSHFAGEDIKYHFMFQFLVGNLEFLGMRIDYAFNVLSALGFISAVSLLYAFAYKISAKRSVGFLTCLFFAFRSSYSVFTFISQRTNGVGILEALKENQNFVSYTTHEDWGLWNLNVYCNQRHFAFSIAVLILILMQFISHLYERFDRLSTDKGVGLLSKEGWKVKDPKLAIASGVLLGSIAFWNGASTIAALLILFGIAIVADRRLEFVISAVIAVMLSVLQSKFFISGSAIKPSFEFGFIAESKNMLGVLDYLLRLTGILPYVLVVAFLMVNGVRKYLMFSFSFPLLFAFTVSLTVDVTVNHKYIMISLMLLSIFAAIMVDKLFSNNNIWLKITCICIVFVLTATGIYDFSMVLKKNKNSLSYDLDDPLTMWVKTNSTSQDIFLTSPYALNNIVLGGAMLFNGHQYYAWSAGYDTNSRDILMKEMFEAETSETLERLVTENNIRFIVVDNDARTSSQFTVNEDTIARTYRAVFVDNRSRSNTIIYDTNYAINE